MRNRSALVRCLSIGIVSCCVQASAADLPALSITTLEITNESGVTLPRLEEYSESALQDFLRQIPRFQTIPSSKLYEIVARDQVHTGLIPGNPQNASALVSEAGARYLLTGTARGYSSDGSSEELDVELVVIDSNRGGYAARKSYTASAPRGDTKGHRALLDAILLQAEPDFASLAQELAAEQEAEAKAEAAAAAEQRRREAEAQRLAAAQAKQQEERRQAERAQAAALREREVAAQEELARTRKTQLLQNALQSARGYLAVKSYNEAFAAAVRAFEIDESSLEAKSIIGEVVANVPRSEIRDLSLARLVWNPVRLIPAPAKIPAKYEGKAIELIGEVTQYLGDTFFASVNDNQFAFKYDGDAAVAIHDLVAVIGLPAGEVTMTTVGGAAHSMPRIRVKYVERFRE